MKEQVLHFFELHFLNLGGLLCVCVFFTFAFTRKSRRLRGRLYAMNGFQKKLLCNGLKTEVWEIV